jgi:dTMP kinase
MDASEREVLDNFIVLEGLDGSGTTTQLELIDRKLTELEIPHMCTSEPTSDYVGSLLRSILKGTLKARHKTIALLFAADRREHLYDPRTGILSRLSRGELVVCDRYLFSSLAYQSGPCGFDFVMYLNREYPLPRHCIFLDTPIRLSQKRLAGRGALELFDDRELQPRITENYERAFASFAHSQMHFHRLEGARDKHEVFQEVWTVLSSLPMIKE